MRSDWGLYDCDSDSRNFRYFSGQGNDALLRREENIRIAENANAPDLDVFGLGHLMGGERALTFHS